MNYYHLTFGFFNWPELDEDWLQREGWNRLFCRDCGVRLEGVQAMDIKFTSKRMPLMLGTYGGPDFGFARRTFLDALGVELEQHFWLGRVIGANNKVIAGSCTFVGKRKCVPIRGREPLTSVGCPTCRRPIFISRPPHRRYVVSKSGLTEPVYESNEAGLVLRQDVFAQVEGLLQGKARVELLTTEQHGYDGRTEPELEY